MGAALSDRRAGFLISIGLIALVSVVFGGALLNEFVRIDDHLYVTENRQVQAGLTPESIPWALSATAASNWHPLTWWSHQLDWQLFGADPRGHHAVSIAWHAANAVLLFWLLRRLLQVGFVEVPNHAATLVAGITAALYAVHPLRVESVAWVAERKDVLSTFFWLLTLWLYLGFAERRTWSRYVLVTVSLALGLLAKPMLVTLPAVMLLLDAWPLRRIESGPGRSKCLSLLVAEKLPWLMLAVISSVVTWRVQLAGGAVLETLPVTAKWANVVLSYGLYLAKSIWPTRLACFYPLDVERLTQRGFADFQVQLSLMALMAISAACLWYARSRPYLMVGWLWFLGTLVPVIGIVKVGDQAWADRYSYVPQMGLWIAGAGWALDQCLRHPNWRRPLGVAATLLLVVSAVLTMRQISTWRTTETLAEQALSATGDNFIAYYLRGVTRQREGDAVAAGKDFERSIALKPDYLPALHDLGVAELETGNLTQAATHFDRVIELAPRKGSGYAGKAAVAAKQGELGKAQELLETAAELESADANVRLNLAAICLAQGDAVAARGWFTSARALDARLADEQRGLEAQIQARLGSGKSDAGSD